MSQKLSGRSARVWGCYNGTQGLRRVLTLCCVAQKCTPVVSDPGVTVQMEVQAGYLQLRHQQTDPVAAGPWQQTPLPLRASTASCGATQGVFTNGLFSPDCTTSPQVILARRSHSVSPCGFLQDMHQGMLNSAVCHAG